MSLRRKSFCFIDKSINFNNNDVYGAGTKTIPSVNHNRRNSLCLDNKTRAKLDRKGSLLARWFKHISDAAEAYKSREGKSRRSEATTPENDGSEPGTSDLPGTEAEKTDLLGSSELSVQENNQQDTDSAATSAENSQRNSGVIEDDDKRLSSSREDKSNGTDGNGSMGSSKREAQMRLATEDQPLIQPSEVTINVLPVHTAQPVVTPIEQVRRKTEAIRQALAEKQALVAEILQIPQENYNMIVDMAGDLTEEKEPMELILAAINSGNQLLSMLSDSMNITEVETVLASSNQNSACSCSPPKQLPNVLPSQRFQDVVSNLNMQLTAIFKVTKEREEKIEKMSKEIQMLRERLHVFNDTQLKTSGLQSTEGAHSDGENCHYYVGDLENVQDDKK